MLLGKPSGITTFGEYADRLGNAVFSVDVKFDKFDETRDRYLQDSIKTVNRIKRTKGLDQFAGK